MTDPELQKVIERVKAKEQAKKEIPKPSKKKEEIEEPEEQVEVEEIKKEITDEQRENFQKLLLNENGTFRSALLYELKGIREGITLIASILSNKE